MKSTKKLATMPEQPPPEAFKDIQDCINWMTHEREVKLNPGADAILFILVQLSTLIDLVHEIEGDVKSVQEDVISISNELTGYDP